MAVSIDDYTDGFQAFVDGCNAIQADDEVKRRMLCNRAYYAMYNLSLEIFDTHHNYRQKSKDLRYSKTPSHKRLTDFIGHIDSVKNRDIVLKLKSMKRLRTLADYKLNKHLTVSACDKAKSEFNDLSILLKQYKP